MPELLGIIIGSSLFGLIVLGIITFCVKWRFTQRTWDYEETGNYNHNQAGMFMQRQASKLSMQSMQS